MGACVSVRIARHHAALLALTFATVLTTICVAPAFAGTPVRVGVYDNPPFLTVDGNDVTGIIPDIIDEVALEHDWDVEYVVGTWPEQLENLDSGSITVVGPVAWTSPRAELYAFSSVTVLGNWGVLTALPDRTKDYSEFEDLEGARIAALRKDVFLDGPGGLRFFLENAGITVEIVEFESYDDALEATAAGDTDLGLINRLANATLGTEYGLGSTSMLINPISTRFAGPANSPEILQALSEIDSTLLRLQADPESAYYASIDRHFGTYGATQTGWPSWALPTFLGSVGLVVLLATLAIAQRFLVRSRTQDLDESLDRFRALFLAIPDAIFTLDTEGRISDFKPAIDWEPAIPPEEFLGRRLSELPLPGTLREQFDSAVSSTAQSGVSRTVPYQLANPMPDGPIRHHEGRFSKASEEELLLIIRDVTEKQLSDQAERDRAIELERAVAKRTDDLIKANLELAAASQAKSVFLANMSHELRTPLNSVIGFSSIMLKGLAGEISDEQRRQLVMINTSGTHLLSLVNDVLDLTRVESGRVEPQAQTVDLDELIAEAAGTIESRARAKGISLTVESHDLGTVSTDRRMLLQILINLLNNAVKYTSAGSIKVGAECHDTSAKISVTDTGVGMSAEQIPHAFQDFYQLSQPETAKSSGFGLGLPISQRLAEMLGGTITVTSVLDSGSTFTVTIPPLNDGEAS